MIELPSTPWLADRRLRSAAVAPSLPVGGAASRPLPGTVRHLFTHLDLSVTVMRGRAVGRRASGCGCRPTASASWPCRP